MSDEREGEDIYWRNDNVDSALRWVASISFIAGILVTLALSHLFGAGA